MAEDWSKLISVASVSFLILSMTLQTKRRFSWIDFPCNVTPRRLHTLYITLLTIRFSANDQLVVPSRVTHISCHYKNTIEGGGGAEKIEGQTIKHEQNAWG